MRFKSFEEFSKRYSEEGAWLRDNRGSDSFASDMYDLICAKSDLTVRQRKQIRKVMLGLAKPSGVPRAGDTLKNVVVRVYRVYTHEERGGVRFVFHHADGWGGRFTREDVVHGRIVIQSLARRCGHDERSFEERQPSAVNFSVTIEACNVAWTAGKGKGYVIFDDVVIDKSRTPPTPPAPRKATPPPELETTPAAPESDTGFGFDDSDEPEADKPATVTVAVSERGAPIPDMSDWAAKFRG